VLREQAALTGPTITKAKATLVKTTKPFFNKLDILLIY